MFDSNYIIIVVIVFIAITVAIGPRRSGGWLQPAEGQLYKHVRLK